MNIELKVQARTYDELKVALLAEAERFYGDRRFGFYNLSVTVDGEFYEATASAYEVTPPRQRPNRTDVPDEAWDPFATGGYDPF